MYLDYFGLNNYPFKLTPDADFLYMSPSHSRALAYMEYAVLNRDGFVVITGEIGSGKTTLVKKLLSELDDNIIVAKVFQTQLDEVELLQAILVEFGLNPFSMKKVELLNMLNQFLVDRYLEGKQILLVIDDAQNLNKRALEEIVLLSGVETQKEKILHVILVGQPEFNETLESNEMAQLLQRVGLRYHVRALTQAETKEYVIHRLKIAGNKSKKLFLDEIYQTIYEFSGGVPRLINTLCDTALTCAFTDEKVKVGSTEFDGVIDELQWDTYAERDKVIPSLNESFYDERQSSGDARDRTAGAIDPVLHRVLFEITKQLTRVADSIEKRNDFVDRISVSLDNKEAKGK